MNLRIFTVFLKNRKFISKIKRSKVADYAALNCFNFLIISICYDVQFNLIQALKTRDKISCQLFDKYTFMLTLNRSGLNSSNANYVTI